MHPRVEALGAVLGDAQSHRDTVTSQCARLAGIALALATAPNCGVQATRLLKNLIEAAVATLDIGHNPGMGDVVARLITASVILRVVQRLTSQGSTRLTSVVRTHVMNHVTAAIDEFQNLTMTRVILLEPMFG